MAGKIIDRENMVEFLKIRQITPVIIFPTKVGTQENDIVNKWEIT